MAKKQACAKVLYYAHLMQFFASTYEVGVSRVCACLYLRGRHFLHPVQERHPLLVRTHLAQHHQEPLLVLRHWVGHDEAQA